jgi:hypothetical protein
VDGLLARSRAGASLVLVANADPDRAAGPRGRAGHRHPGARRAGLRGL